MLSSMRKRISVPALVAEATDLSTRPSSASSTPSGGNAYPRRRLRSLRDRSCPGIPKAAPRVSFLRWMSHSSSPMQLVTSFDVAGQLVHLPQELGIDRRADQGLHDGQRLETNSGQLDSQGDAFQSPTSSATASRSSASNSRPRSTEAEGDQEIQPLSTDPISGMESGGTRNTASLAILRDCRPGEHLRYGRSATATTGAHSRPACARSCRGGQDPSTRMCCASVSTAQPVEARQPERTSDFVSDQRGSRNLKFDGPRAVSVTTGDSSQVRRASPSFPRPEDRR